MNDLSDTDDPNGDGEGVWSPDIEQCFLEALKLFPPCGRRKHIIQGEGGGKMLGRNELIALHIQKRTGKVRTRKQVSSHIQVLARRKARVEASRNSGEDMEGVGSSMSSSPASSIAMSVGNHHEVHSQHFHVEGNQHLSNNNNDHSHHQQQSNKIANPYFDVWADRPIATNKIRLVEFSAFIEYQNQLRSQQPNLHIATTANEVNSPAMALANLASMTTTDISGRPASLNGVSNGVHNGLIGPTSYLDCNGAIFSTTQSSALPSHPTMPGHFNPHEAYQQVNGLTQLQQPLNNNHQHHQQLNQQMGASNYVIPPSVAHPMGLNYQPNPALQMTTSVTRHSFVKIDYRQTVFRQSTKLEHIDISQIQDKFPEIMGPEGLYQRGPPDAFYLVKFWADMNNDFEYNIEDQNTNFGFSCSFETLEPFKNITCSTKACSYGSQVVEKVEKIQGALSNSNGRYLYNIDRSPMCEFMIQFIKKLRQLPRTSQMNSVLENFSVLQVVTSESTSEILLCLAFVFEIASSEQHIGSQYNVYKLNKD